MLFTSSRTGMVSLISRCVVVKRILLNSHLKVLIIDTEPSFKSVERISRLSASNPPLHRFPARHPDSLSSSSHRLSSKLCARQNQLQLGGLPQSSQICQYHRISDPASNEHKYDIKIKLSHLPRMPQFGHSDDPSRDASTESETPQGLETPASSLDFDMANIDPRFMEPGPITIMEPSTCQPSTKISASSAGHPVTSTD